VVRGSIPLGALLIALQVTPVQAQGQSPGGLDSASILLLKPDRFVRLRVPDLGRVQGRVGFLSPTELTLQAETEYRTIRLAAVDTLWVRGRRTKAGAIIGAILGIGGGIFLGAVGDALCEYDCNGNYVVTGGVLGGLAGGVTGAIIGSAFPRWRRVFPD
jgi:hypothetical protein